MRPFTFICVLLFSGAAAQASSIAINNAGFEDPVLADGDFE